MPIQDVPERGAHLRVEPARNNQAKGVRWARDYVLGPAAFLGGSAAAVTDLARSALPRG